MKFFYLSNSKNQRVACVVSQRITNSFGLDVIAFAVSTCNPLDKFSKLEARTQAVKNLDQASWTLTFKGVKRHMLNVIFADKKFPQRARDAAKLWLKNHPIVN